MGLSGDMTRGKIQIKKIENTTNRQVTFSKRKNGLFKKAHELTVLCDAKVSIILLSSTDKLHAYISSNVTLKQIYDEYQKTIRPDLWDTHYERLQEQLRKSMEANKKLQLEISRRIGQNLEGMTFIELCGLEQDIEGSVKDIREKKYKSISSHTDTTKKKARSAQETHKKLLHEYNAREQEACHPDHWDHETSGHYDGVMGYPNGGIGGLPHGTVPVFALCADHRANNCSGGGLGLDV